eukprot:12776773-Alexandrium_andersonii.AAC.1
MSASLVGSEMCIRDSHLGRRLCLGRAGWSGHLDSRWCFRHLPSQCTRHTVSYTHLTLPTICSV